MTAPRPASGPSLGFWAPSALPLRAPGSYHITFALSDRLACAGEADDLEFISAPVGARRGAELPAEPFCMPPHQDTIVRASSESSSSVQLPDDECGAGDFLVLTAA